VLLHSAERRCVGIGGDFGAVAGEIVFDDEGFHFGLVGGLIAPMKREKHVARIKASFIYVLLSFTYEESVSYHASEYTKDTHKTTFSQKPLDESQRHCMVIESEVGRTTEETQ